jgi:hypothetical protein
MGIFQRRRDRKLFQDFVSAEALAKVQGKAQLSVGRVEEQHFQFVVILADDSNPHEIPGTISAVVACLLQHGATLSNLSSSLLVGLLGVPFSQGDSPEERHRLVETLLRQNGDRIRIAHGQCYGAVGLLGTNERCTYGEVIPRFSAILKRLLETNFGTAVEIDSKPSTDSRWVKP